MNVMLSDCRSVIGRLEEGPKSHNELVSETEYGWDDVQSIIRELRNEGEVRIRIDRRYERV